MCKFLSAVVTRTGEIYCDPDHTDSHDDIIAAFHLRATASSYYAQSFCRVEFTPPEDTSTICDMSTWTLHVDEGTTPEWFNHDTVREELMARVERMFIADARRTLLGGCWIFSGPGASAKRVVHGRIVFVGNGADMKYADMKYANMQDADMRNADMRYVNMQYANMQGANMQGVIMQGADMQYADMRSADMQGAIMQGAVMQGADMQYSNLQYAIMQDANMKYANMRGAIMPDGTTHA
jgi:hypothetical protein